MFVFLWPKMYLLERNWHDRNEEHAFDRARFVDLPYGYDSEDPWWTQLLGGLVMTLVVPASSLIKRLASSLLSSPRIWVIKSAVAFCVRLMCFWGKPFSGRQFVAEKSVNYIGGKDPVAFIPWFKRAQLDNNWGQAHTDSPAGPLLSHCSIWMQ